MVDSLSNIRYQNSIYYNNYNIVNQVFKATFFTESMREGIRSRVLCGICVSDRMTERDRQRTHAHERERLKFNHIDCGFLLF